MKIHLIGVAGSGMSGLALLLLGMGHKVSGCDRVTSDETIRMQGLGLRFSSPHCPDSIQDADLVVYSSAIRPCNVAREAAEKAGIPCILRAQCLAAILHTTKGVIVSGTHGKTTTSSLATHILRKGDLSPSHYVGAEIPVLGTNAEWNPKGEYMVAEGDESDGTLALFRPEHSIVLNIEEEHLDFYRDIEHIKSVFTKLIDSTRGKIIYCGDDPVARELCGVRENGISYGWDNADFTAKNIVERGGVSSYDVYHHENLLGRVELGIPGKHNVSNSLAAIALAVELGVAFQHIARALSTFAGARRRFETKYFSRFIRVVDDYGHHPTEISATLQTARSLEPKRLVVLFQPHRFSRTEKLQKEFGVALNAADVVYVTNVYAASEDPIPGISGQTIVDQVKANGHTKVYHVPNLAAAHLEIGNNLQEGDLFLTLGAGNVHEVAKRLVADLQILDSLQMYVGNQGSLVTKLYEPMRRHTTILIGGPAQYWIEPLTFDAFAKSVEYFKQRGIPVRVVGRGSNLLVRDGGIRGAVIHPNKGEFGDVSVNCETITAGVGTRLKKIASSAQQAGIGGFEWMEGIPGNVGGSLRMNAGAMGIETFDQVVSVTFLDEDGQIRTRTREEIESQYRNVPELRRNFALRAVFKGAKDQDATIQQRLDESKHKRRTSQPVAASAGCIFKNPEGIGAGKLIDELGLKTSKVGNAEISEIHGNFFVNNGNAKASDVLQLIEQVKKTAHEQRGITMDTEVQILGEDVCPF